MQKLTDDKLLPPKTPGARSTLLLESEGETIDEITQHIDMMSHKQACIDLEKATQIITQALQHEAGRNQELCVLIRRLEEREVETGRILAEQAESNRQLKLKIDELQKHLKEKDNSLSQATQTVAFLKNEQRDLHQQLRRQQSNHRTTQDVNESVQDGESQFKVEQMKSDISPLQSAQLTTTQESLVWSEPLVLSEARSLMVSSEAQSPLVLSSHHSPPVSSSAESPLLSSHTLVSADSPVSAIKEEDADDGYEYSQPVMDAESFRQLLSFIKSSLPKLRDPEPLLEHLQGLGVEDLRDLSFLQESDLLTVLRPVQARKLLALLKKTSQQDVLDCPQSNQSNQQVSRASTSTGPGTQSFEMLLSGAYSSETASSPWSTSSSSMDTTPRQLSDNSWHFHFQIPWQKIPAEIFRKLETRKRPTKCERLGIIRLVVGEIFTKCPRPGKKHISEIARMMTKAYPVAFTDVIEGEVVGSGYDSLTKQMVSRVDNLKRGNTSLFLKRKVISSSEGDDTPTLKRRLDTYGCINWQLTRMPADETPESQKHVQEELKKMWRERCCDGKAIENMMRATFFTQRKDIISGTDTSDLTKEWPYLFETTGMKTHFKELTGADMEDKHIANKCARVISFLKSGDKTGKMEAIFREMETSGKMAADVNVAVLLPLLLKYFNEEEGQMFYRVDPTTPPSEVDCAGLPSTPCIVMCGNSTLAAETFMLSVDQTIVNGHIRVFSDALTLMFGLYYCMNISYPAAQASTLEFLQRCLFKINPDKGSKVERKATTKHAVSPKVLTLITNIADYEWRE